MAVRLIKWNLDFCRDSSQIKASGNSFDHPKFLDGAYVYTSVITETWFEEGILYVRTESGRLYELALEDINMDEIAFEKTKECFGGLDISMEILDHVAVYVKEKEKHNLAHADMQTEDGDLFLQVAGGDALWAYFKQDGKLYTLGINCHTGMFQDSMLVGKYGVVDYRYYPSPCRMETYHVSDGIQHLVVENIGKETVEIDGKEYLPGVVERTVITKDYCQEGLFSADSVNGKCAWSELLGGE